MSYIKLVNMKAVLFKTSDNTGKHSRYYNTTVTLKENNNNYNNTTYQQ